MEWRGRNGSVLQPFASPGDVVTLRHALPCSDSSSPFGPTPADNVVTIVVRPTSSSGGPAHVVVLATDCAALDANRQECAARGDVATVSCIQANDVGGPPTLEITEDFGSRELRFRVPDTDELITGPGDGRGLAGPATIAVSAAGAPIPCGLASENCGLQSGLSVCVDDLFDIDGSCSVDTPGSTFSHFTLLPSRNDFAALCQGDAPCNGAQQELRLTTDRDGNLLLPMDWSGVLASQSIPVAQLVRMATSVGAFADGGAAIGLPGNEFVSAFSTDGQNLPPVMTPKADLSGSAELALFGTAEASATVIRILRRSPSFQECAGGDRDSDPCSFAEECPAGTCGTATCRGGANGGIACTADAECWDGGGECGGSLFEFRDRNTAGAGPVVIARAGGGICEASGYPGTACSGDGDCTSGQCVAYRFSALGQAPLGGLFQTDDLNAFVAHEAQSGSDQDGDGDAVDHVVELLNLGNGIIEPIGSGGARGRAVVNVEPSPPFSFPAIAVEGDSLAFLESESNQAFADGNDNGQVFETLWRVFRLGPVDLTPSPSRPRAADARPLVDGRSLAVSGGKAFARVSEAAAARRRTVRVSVSSTGTQGNNHSLMPILSGDGRTVAFVSHASNLVTGDTNNFCDDTDGWGVGTTNCPDVFVHDLVDGHTARVSVATDGAETNRRSLAPSLSHDGRFVLFYSAGYNLSALPPGSGEHVYVHDRDLDVDGVFDETGPEETKTQIVDVHPDGSLPMSGNGNVGFQAISADGRFVYFGSTSALVPEDTNGIGDLYVRDRDLDEDGIFDEPELANGTTERLTHNNDGSQFIHNNWCADSATAAMSPVPCASTADCSAGQFCYNVGNTNDPSPSADGRYLAFGTYSQHLLPPGHSEWQQVFVYDRTTGLNEQVSITSDGDYPNGACFGPRISAEGRYVFFSCWATNMVPGDTNGARDVFVRDRWRGTTTRVSMDNDGRQIMGDTESAIPSGDGRYLVWRSFGRGYVPGHVFDGQFQTYLHDSLTGATTRVSNRPDGGQSDSGHFLPYSAANIVTTSHDGSATAFTTTAADILAPGEKTNYACRFDNWSDTSTTSPCMDVFVNMPDPADPLGADHTGDGDLSDTVLDVVDTVSGTEQLLCPAAGVSVAGGRAAFLSPEAAGAAPSLSCPQNSAPSVGSLPDLNGDGDATDQVVMFWPGSGAVENLRCAADEVAVSETHVAALVSEADAGTDLDGDSLLTHRVVALYEIGDPAPSNCADWTSTGQPATEMRLSGSFVAFTTSETDAGISLNGDSDTGDEVLQIYDAAAGTLTNVGRAVDDFVTGAAMVAFRVNEAAQGGIDLNGDADTDDSILQVYDTVEELVYDSGEAAVPCTDGTCDERHPYRVFEHSVKFLAFDATPATLMNQRGIGASNFLGASHFNKMSHFKPGLALGAAPGPMAGTFSPWSLVAWLWEDRVAVANPDAITVLAASPSGICSTSGEACIPNGIPCPDGGTCFVPPGICARQTATTCDISGTGACGSADIAFCRPVSGVSGVCYQKENECDAASDCSGGAVCVSDNQTFNHLTNPMGDQAVGGDMLFASVGRCAQERTSCAVDAECPFGDTCEAGLVSAVAADTDKDEVPDILDNCPSVPNPNQSDDDADGVGNPCDAHATCSDGTLDADEACDDANLTIGDGCDSNCQIEPCHTCDGGSPSSCPAVANGVSCDDGLFCNGEDVCQAGDCSHGGNACGGECQTSCSEALLACIAPVGTTCSSDGDPCTVDECNGSGTCTHVASPTGTPCDADSDACTQDICDNSGACSHPEQPSDECREVADKYQLVWKRTADGTKDSFSWKYGKAEETAQGEFADPVNGSADYTMCVYDDNGVVSRTFVLHGGNCDGGPCWEVSSKGRFSFGDKAASQFGVSSMRLTPGPASKVQIQVKGKGPNVPDLALPVSGGVTVQLFNSESGVCWGSRWNADRVSQDAIKGTLKAK